MNEHRLPLYCLASGRPTVILEAGASSWSVVWSLVQEELAESTQVCSYDRAGFGWSEAGPGPRTADRLVGELKTLLTRAEVEGPYVLVGHSFGGALVRVIADRYPEEVAGLVLVDATHPEQAARLLVDFEQGLETQSRQFRTLAVLAQLGSCASESKAMCPRGRCRRS